MAILAQAPSLLPAVPFFSRSLSATMACPKCGEERIEERGDEIKGGNEDKAVLELLRRGQPQAARAASPLEWSMRACAPMWAVADLIIRIPCGSSVV